MSLVSSVTRTGPIRDEVANVLGDGAPAPDHDTTLVQPSAVRVVHLGQRLRIGPLECGDVGRVTSLDAASGVDVTRRAVLCGEWPRDCYKEESKVVQARHRGAPSEFT